MSFYNFFSSMNMNFMFGMFNSSPIISCFGGYGSLFNGRFCGFNNLFDFSPSLNTGSLWNFNIFQTFNTGTTSIFQPVNMSGLNNFSGIWSNTSFSNSGLYAGGNSIWGDKSFVNNVLTETKENDDIKNKEKKKYSSGQSGTVTDFYKGTAKDLDKKLANRGVLKGKGAKFIEMQNKYGISASFLAAICIQESGGTSNLAKKNNNVAGITQGKGWRKFGSVDECIEFLANLLRKQYVDKGLITVSQIHQKYCPVTGDSKDKNGTNKGWGNAVAGIKNGIDKAIA